MKKDLIDTLYKNAIKNAHEDFDSPAHLKDLLKGFQIRQVELKFLELFSGAKISGTVHTCVGQELTGIIVNKYLNDIDWITSNHRCHGHYIARTGDWKGLIRELLGLETGVSRGIGSSQHLYNERFISNGTQGSLLPVACGIGMSMKRKKNNGIAVSFIGEGTLGEGIVYETFNLAAVFESPHLIICENNYYSQSTAQADAIAGSIIDRASAFGLEVFESDTWHLDHLNQTSEAAVNYVRTAQKPAFLKINTYRLLAHSKGDDNRELGEVEKFKEIDLVNRLISSKKHDEKLIRIKDEVEKFSEEVFKEYQKINYEEYATDQLPRAVSAKVKIIENEQISMAKALSRSYKKLIEDDDAIFIGEDIADPYGGAFKITKGFQDSYPQNIYSTPISEAGLVGIAIGMNLDGCNSIAEIMFGDFIVNAMDQIVNNASKFHHMYGKQLSCNVTIRTPMGGRRGYGPTHSQSLEKLILGIDNTMVAAFTSLCDPDDLITGLKSVNCPKILIENKTDYSNFLYKPPDRLTLEKIGGPLGTIRILPRGVDPTLLVITYGYMGRLIADNYLKIFRDTDCVFGLMAPQLLHPIPLAHFEKMAQKAQNVLIVEEGTACFGWADGVAAMMSDTASDIKISRLSSDPVPIPSSRELEDYNLVSLDKIIMAINKQVKANG